MSLEEVLESKLEHAEKVLAEEAGLTDLERKVLAENKPEVEITDEPGIIAYYNPLKNRIVASREAVYNNVVIGEEKGHQMQMVLNTALRNHVLSLEPARDKAAYQRAMALIEHFGRYAGMIYSSRMGGKKYQMLWPSVKDKIIIIPEDTSADYMAHLIGYLRAERDFLLRGTKGFNKELLYKMPEKAYETAYPSSYSNGVFVPA